MIARTTVGRKTSPRSDRCIRQIASNRNVAHLRGMYQRMRHLVQCTGGNFVIVVTKKFHEIRLTDHLFARGDNELELLIGKSACFFVGLNSVMDFTYIGRSAERSDADRSINRCCEERGHRANENGCIVSSPLWKFHIINSLHQISRGRNKKRTREGSRQIHRCVDCLR